MTIFEVLRDLFGDAQLVDRVEAEGLEAGPDDGPPIRQGCQRSRD